MKIAIAIEKFQPSAGGRERSTQQIARRLLSRGHAVTIFTNRADTGEDPLPGGKVVVRGGLNTRYAAGLWGFSRWAAREMGDGGFDATLSVGTAVPADVVQLREGTVREELKRKLDMKGGGESMRTLRILATLVKPKLMVRLALERKTLRDPRVKRIVAISRYVARQLFDYYSLGVRRVTLIPNAAEVRAFDPAERLKIREEVRRAFALNDGEVVFLFVSMDPARKGLASLLRGFAAVVEADPRAKLLVAGTLDAGWLEMATALGVGDPVRWVGPTRMIDRLYVAADVCVLPTWYDPSSKVVLEALLHGLPAISTAHNGASDWISYPAGPEAEALAEGNAGAESGPAAAPQPAGRVIDDAGDIAALTAAMIELCDDGERARCAAAASTVGPQITMARHVDELEALMMKLAAKTG